MTLRGAALLMLVVGAVLATTTQGSSPDDAPIVTDPELGQIRGVHMDTLFGKPFSAFKGIPYVQKLEPQQRYQYAKPWNKTIPLAPSGKMYDATYFRSRCPQTSYLSALGVKYSGSEDCLHLSIYTPLTNTTNAAASSKGRPVMVFIHGGSYNSGEAVLYQPTRLMQRDVVVVVVQYRLGILGFLCANSADAPGNQGLHDQYQGIKWVSEHIQNFGGDPSLVTLAGQSAGAASVSLLMTSPLIYLPEQNKKPLVHRFMPMSGSSLEYWTLAHHTWKEDLDFLARKVSWSGKNPVTPGCYNADPKKALQCMVEKPLESIVVASSDAYKSERLAGNLGFRGQTPRIQVSSADYESVLIEHPLVAYENNRFAKQPVMAGSVRDEGSLPIGLMYRDYMIPAKVWNDTEFMKQNLTEVLANSFGYTDGTEALANTFRMAFLPHGMELGNFSAMAGGLVDLTSVLFLKSGSYKSMNSMLNVHPNMTVYYYSFEFESPDSLYPWLMMSSQPIPVPRGVCHTDDLLHMFALPSHFDARQKEMSKKMTTLYWNFFKYGDPTPASNQNWIVFAEKWNKLSVENLNYQLLNDHITAEEDIVVRWNHHIWDNKKMVQQEEDKKMVQKE